MAYFLLVVTTRRQQGTKTYIYIMAMICAEILCWCIVSEVMNQMLMTYRSAYTLSGFGASSQRKNYNVPFARPAL